jgi:hypothetical protein
VNPILFWLHNASLTFEFQCDIRRWLVGFSWSDRHYCLNLLWLSLLWSEFD